MRMVYMIVAEITIPQGKQEIGHATPLLFIAWLSQSLHGYIISTIAEKSL